MAGVDGEHDGSKRREVAAAGLGLGFLGEQGERGEGEQQGSGMLLSSSWREGGPAVACGEEDTATAWHERRQCFPCGDRKMQFFWKTPRPLLINLQKVPQQSLAI